ncbi:carbonic anhydrase 1 [Drosophila obscura]|uniref:carbonic anhydrase 1 n=1 Tax=Drosophila obscura TaxID=7282 RepID=UPI001BB15CD8|nr:carbonic anhydrase 1 [Drosophila obscura]
MLYLFFDIWQQFMQGFGIVICYAQGSQVLTILVSCILSLAFLNNASAVSLIVQAVVGVITTKKPKRKLDPQPTPINIVRKMTRKTVLGRQLVWTNYDHLPLAMLLENNGSTVILRICCESNMVPQLSGGELPDQYHLVEACFKWGELRAEHSIDSVQFSLEMQVLHRCYQDRVPFQHVSVSYLFLQMGGRNDPLTQITENLRCVAHPDSKIELPAFDLASLMNPFGSSFYSYTGTYDNGVQVVPTMWLINTHIFPISSEQLSQFGALCGRDGNRIKCNARQEQPLGNRSVHFNFI